MVFGTPVRLSPLEQETVRQFREFVEVGEMAPEDMLQALSEMRRDLRARGLPFDPLPVLVALYASWDWGRIEVLLPRSGRFLRPPD